MSSGESDDDSSADVKDDKSSASSSSSSSSSAPSPSSSSAAGSDQEGASKAVAPRQAVNATVEDDSARRVSPQKPKKTVGSVKIKRPKKRRNRNGANGEDGFVLDLNALQGRWLHSLGLGCLTVKGKDVIFDRGMTFQLSVSGSVITMLGWTASHELSSADAIKWTKPGEGSCTWSLEDEVPEDDALEGIDVRNIIQSKRRGGRGEKVDYKELNKKMVAEERARAAAMVDEAAAHSDDNGADQAMELTTAKEHSERNANRVAKGVQLFHDWVLSTRTPLHEEKLRRRGVLLKMLPVVLTGAAQNDFDREMLPYGCSAAYRSDGTSINLSAAARERFRDMHRELWDSAPPPKRPEVSSTINPSAQLGPPQPKKRKRVIDDEDEDAVEAPAASTNELRKDSSIVAASTLSAAVPCAAIKEVEPSTSPDAVPKETMTSCTIADGILDAKSGILDAKSKLEKKPSVEDVLAILAFLSEQQVNISTLIETKIGVEVNKLKKHADADVVAEADKLVAKWKVVFHEYQQSVQKSKAAS